MALSFNFVTILGGGKLALSERPKVKDIKKLNVVECDRVVTILGPKGEQAHKIGAEVESCGMAWDWVKVTNANKITDQEKMLFRKSVQVVYDAILSGENVIVHCSAGLHRTGMFAFAILRKGNIERNDALAIIEEIRQKTFEALEEKYLLLAEDLH